jgi:hypothetical protein
MSVNGIEIVGNGFVVSRDTVTEERADFRIAAAPPEWEDREEGAVHLRIWTSDRVIKDGAIRGVDDMQALELAVAFVRTVLRVD